AKSDLEHELERTDFERNLLEGQLNDLQQVRERLEQALTTMILDHEEQLVIHEETVSSPRTVSSHIKQFHFT
ncbi:hypothetical protein Ciccas_013685, partial [Cichlidogyrus casuarinus]